MVLLAGPPGYTPQAKWLQVGDEAGKQARTSLNFQQESDIDSNLAMLVLLLKPHNYSDVVRPTRPTRPLGHLATRPLGHSATRPHARWLCSALLSLARALCLPSLRRLSAVSPLVFRNACGPWF